MIFSLDSPITLVVTSCGRFDLLKRTLLSFDRHNTAPIHQVLITEDSGDEAVHDAIPDHWRAHTQIWINRPKLGQMRSIDKAYAEVKTPYIFHCEDDWEFYRPGFIEESLCLLENDPQALQVWLRSLNHDLAIHSPYVSAGERRIVNGIAYHVVQSEKSDWQGFSFNPGLRRLADYLPHAPYHLHGGEKQLSRLYADLGRYALILENDAVLHTGFGEHVTINEERHKKLQRKRRERVRLGVMFFFGLLVGLLI